MFESLFAKKKQEPFVAVDIGTSAIKVMELDIENGHPVLVAAGSTPTPANCISNNIITDPNKIGEAIHRLLTELDISAVKATIVIPGPCAFTKKITIGYTDPKDLATTIRFEAANYIPHNINAVHLDYQVLRVNGMSTMDVMLVAVKNEIILSYLRAVEAAGLEPAIADVDYFAIANMFALNYPDEHDKTVALVNVGARYASVNILQKGQSLFVGDIGVGGRLYTDALHESLGMEPLLAERAKMGQTIEGFDRNVINETIERTTEHVASELQRQLGFFWNAAGTDKTIDAIYVCGGAAQVPGLIEELSAKTGTICRLLDVFRHVDWSTRFDADYIHEIGMAMGVSVGLAKRRFGDKERSAQEQAA